MSEVVGWTTRVQNVQRNGIERPMVAVTLHQESWFEGETAMAFARSMVQSAAKLVGYQQAADQLLQQAAELEFSASLQGL